MMITIGITGGVGAGKSTVLDFLEEKYQAYVMKADEIGHLVMEPGQSCYEPVIALFGRQIIKNDKSFYRIQVSDVVFSHPELLVNFNQIIHPSVFQCKNTGHNLCSTCHRKLLFTVFRIQNTPGVCIHQTCRTRIKF